MSAHILTGALRCGATARYMLCGVTARYVWGCRSRGGENSFSVREDNSRKSNFQIFSAKNYYRGEFFFEEGLRQVRRAAHGLKGRVGNHDVGLLEYLDALFRSEVSIPLEAALLYVFLGGEKAILEIPSVVDADAVFGLVLAEEVAICVLVAGGDEPAKAQETEVLREIFEEGRHARVVAIAEHHFVAKMLAIVAEFVFDVGELGVELILLCHAGVVEVVCHRGVFLAKLEFFHPVPKKCGHVDMWTDKTI